MLKKIGFLSMQFEKEEKRDFRPRFFEQLKDIKQEIILDFDYGKKLGYGNKDYIAVNSHIRFSSRKDVLQADLLVSVRTPGFEELELMNDGAAIFSMLHFVTHSRRNEYLLSRNIRMFAMDSVVDDFGLRMIQDFPGTVTNAMKAGYDEYFKSHSVNLLKVLVIGTGEIGKLAVDIAVHLSPVPTIVSAVGRSVTVNTDILRDLLKETDILIDATKRSDTSKYIISNELIGFLPENAVIIDLSADDYDTSIDPPQVKGIEGIPTGFLDKYVFCIDDPVYDSIPENIDTSNRRKVVSCYSWPAVNPVRCLDIYEKQLLPFLQTLAEKDYPDIHPLSENFYARSLAKGNYTTFIKEL